MVDIIIPAYNCSKTLPKTLASIAAQTKVEKCIVTIVDDCSTEDLKPIIKLFRENFHLKINYIKLNQNLKYPGLVRQVGLNNSNAPYILFVDSDDFLDPRAVELANTEMRQSNSDVIVSHFYREDENKQWQLMDETQTTWLHGNFYKRSFLEKNEIKFSAGYNEDGGFNTQCYLLAEKTSKLSTPIYYWCHNEKSLTRSEECFSEKYGKDFLSTLIFAYENIIKQRPENANVFCNMAKHLAFSYQLLNKMCVAIKDEEHIAEYYLELKKFAEILFQKKIFKDIIKKSFIDGCLKYPNSKILIPMEEFLHSIDAPFEIKVEDFISTQGE